MIVEISPAAIKYISKLDSISRERIKKALMKLSLEPPASDIIKM